MEFADILLNKIEGEGESKKPLNALVCFTDKRTAKALGGLIGKMVRFKVQKSSITVLNLMDAEQAQQVQDEHVYKSELFSDFLKLNENNNISIRTFVKQSDNYLEDVLRTAEEYNCNHVMLGIGSDRINSVLWEKYARLKTDNLLHESDLNQVLGEEGALFTKNLSALMAVKRFTTEIFIENGYLDLRNIFAPILVKEDSFSFPYIYQFAKNPDMKVKLWDAIGLMASNQKYERLFLFVSKKTDGVVRQWNNNKKIESDFIEQQDLVVISLKGWEKLIGSALGWRHQLPSVLIINDQHTL